MKRTILVLLLLAGVTLAQRVEPGTGTSVSGSGNATSLQNVPVAATAPSNSQVLTYNGSQWAPAAAGGSAPVVYPESYGAKGNGKFVFDGAITPPTLVQSSSSGSSATPATPAITTVAANSQAIYVYLTSGSWSAAPATGSSRILQGVLTGAYELAVNDQPIASAGSVGTASGTLSSSGYWVTGALGLQPASGSSIAYVSSSNTHQAGGSTTVTVNAPGGVASGDMLIGCVGFYGGTLAVPSGWVEIFSTTDANNDVFGCYSYVAGGSTPASFTFTQTGTGGMTAGIVAYSGVATVSQLTSATASFTSSDVGKAVCTSGTGPGGIQQCGSISAYTSATSVSVNYLAAATVSSVWFVYGTDDSSAFSTMLSSAPCSTVGCRVELGTKMYMVTQSFTLPDDRTIQIVGQGYGVGDTANSYLNGNTAPNANMGSRIDWATTGLTAPAITVGGVSHVTSTTAFDLLRDFAMYAGAGRNRDGGGADGLDVLNFQGFEAERLAVVGFSGNGVLVDGVTGSSYQDYVEQNYFAGCYFLWNGASGFQIGRTTNYINNIETTAVYDSVSENNGGPGIYLAGKSIQGFTLRGTVVQWNNVNGSNTEMAIYYTSGASAPNGCNVISNYFEADTNGGSHSSAWITPNAIGCNLIGNFVASNAISGYTGINTTSPTTQLTVNGTATVSALANGCSGSATLAAGTVTVSNACILGTRPITVTEVNTGTPNAVGVSAQSAGSLTIKSASGTDTSTVYWSQQ